MPGKLGLGCHSFRWVLSGAGLKQPDRNLRIANRNLESHSAPDAVTPRPPPAPACSTTRLACWPSPVGFFAVRHTADLSLVSSPVGRCPSGRSVSQVSSQFALRRWFAAPLVACDSVASPSPTAKRTPVGPVAVGSRSRVPPPGLPQFREDRNNASRLAASRTPDIREVVAMVDAPFSGGGRQRRQSSLSPFASSKSQEATSSFSLSTAPQS
nr:hypothetical protein Iba_chr10fCG7920 [Ipomoea batatas]